MASTTIFERKGLRFGMESSPASAEVKGSGQAEERETETKKKTERKKKKKSGEEEVGIRVNNKRRRACKVQKHRCLVGDVGEGGGGGSLPAHAVATGSPVEPGWKVDCRSKRSLSIFTALQTGKKTTKDVFTGLQATLFCS